MALRLLSTWVVTLASVTLAQPTDGGEPLARVASALRGGGGVMLATGTRHQLRGYASELQHTRLDALPALTTCADLACLQAALKTCRPARLDVYEPLYGCGTGAEKERRVGWYAVGKHPAGGCGVLLFAGRGERVESDRWCRGVPHRGYEFFCPDDAWVTESRKRDEAMRAAMKKRASAQRKR